MRISEIIIDRKKVLFESLMDAAATIIADNIESMRAETDNFSKPVGDVLFESDISDFLFYFETQNKKLSTIFNNSHQTTRILISIIGYLKGQSI